MRPLSNRAQHSQQKLPTLDNFEPSRITGPENSSTPSSSPKREVASSTKSVRFLVSVHSLLADRHNLELRSERLLRVLLRRLFRRLAHKATDITDSLARKGPQDSAKTAHQMSVDEQQLNSLIQELQQARQAVSPNASLALKRNSLPVDRAGSTQPPSGFSAASATRVAQSATHTPIPNQPPPPTPTAAALSLASSGGLLSTVTPPPLQLPGPGIAAQEHRRSGATSLAVARAPSRERPLTDSLAGTRESDFQPGAGFAGHSHHKSTKQSYDRAVIERQHREIELLMTELQQRDRELNTLWNNHQRQSDSVQADRVAVVQLTRALKVREGDLFSRNDEVEALRSKLRLVDEEQADRKMMLSTAQTQLEKLNAQLTSAMTQIREVEEKNIKLDSNTRELESTLDVLEQREKEMLALLKQKDVELSERALRLAALQERVQQLELGVQERDKAALELQSRLAEATNENERLELALTAEKEEVRRAMEAREQVVRDHQETHREVDRLHTEAEELESRLQTKEQEAETLTLRLRRYEEELEDRRKRNEEQLNEMRTMYRSLSSANQLLRSTSPERSQLTPTQAPKRRDVVEDIHSGPSLALVGGHLSRLSACASPAVARDRISSTLAQASPLLSHISSNSTRPSKLLSLHYTSERASRHVDVDLLASGDLQVPTSSASSASNGGGAGSGEGRSSGRSSGEGELVLGLGVGAYGHYLAERRRQPAALELSTRSAAVTGAGATRTSTTPATPAI